LAHFFISHQQCHRNQGRQYGLETFIEKTSDYGKTNSALTKLVYRE